MIKYSYTFPFTMYMYSQPALSEVEKCAVYSPSKTLPVRIVVVVVGGGGGNVNNLLVKGLREIVFILWAFTVKRCLQRARVYM